MVLDDLKLEAVGVSKRLKLGNGSARIDDAPPKEEVEEATKKLLERLDDLQNAFYADGRHALLLVLQGRDASGKDGLIRKVVGAFNPMGVRITSFGVPSEEESSHDYLWRIHRAAPPRQMIGVWNRSHYEDVLVVRVKEQVPPRVWRKRFEQINDFEKMLSRNNVTIRKCFLHVSHAEQHERLHSRLENPKKNWKFRLGDLEDREKWDAYTDAYRDVLTRCSTKHAPWYVVPSDDNAIRNYLVARMLVETLESLKLKYPVMDGSVRAAAEAAQW